jgi:hypothetical protein
MYIGKKLATVAWTCMLKQPPSMYTSITTPLDVWLVPGQAGYKPPMLFYKAPHTLPCDFVIKLPKACLETEETATTTKAEPRMVRLLERSGINLRQNCRLPPPPAICVEWWEEIEKIAKKPQKRTYQTQPKYGLGYVHLDSAESEGDKNNDPRRVMCSMTSVIPDKNDMDDATSGKKDCSPYSTPHQPRSFQAAANADQGLRDEQYLLNRVYEKINVE